MVHYGKTNSLPSIIVTFKDLQRLVQAEGGQAENILGPLHELQGKPFWIWDRPSHKQADIGTKGDCCFNHIIGLPTKDGIKKPMFDYEKMLYKAILEPGYLNSSPSLHSHDPDNILISSSQNTYG